ncbi:MAG TPA: PIN domain-containing protein [Candidatus Polarisedimenticolia bacterium]|nr:PIN domain-containing protein [Candidatus Polarisedimenticolia bacterium]
MKVFVDTSALYALIDEDDPMHLAAVRTLRGLRGVAELVTHNCVVVEAITLVRRRLGPAAETRLIDDVLPVIATIWVDEVTHRVALAGYRAQGGSGSLVDHLSFAVMHAANIDMAFAFDIDFERHGFRQAPQPPTEPPPKRLSEADATYAPDPGLEPSLVSVAEIAERSGRPSNTIQSWRRRHRDFPRPIAKLASGPVWTWPSVEAWIAERARR